MKKRVFAFSVFLLIVLSCFSFLYLFPVLGSDSMKAKPSMKFKEWQVGRSDKGTDTSNEVHLSFITSTQTLCRFTASVGYGNIPNKQNTSPIDPNTVVWSVVGASHNMKLDKKSVQQNWSGSSPSNMAADTSFNVVGSLTVPKVVGTRTVEYTDKNGKKKTKQVPDYISSTSCSHPADAQRLKRTPVHRGGKKMKFSIKFSAQTVAKQKVEAVLKLAADDKDQIRQEYVDYNRPIPSRGDSKWSAQDTYDFGHYETMLNDGLSGYLKKWVDEINKQRQDINIENAKKDPDATPLEDLTIDDFVVTSGYRNPHHNFDHSGSTSLMSTHMFGYALDVRGRDIDGVPGEDQQKMMDAAEAAESRYEAKYSTGHVHADWAPTNWARLTSTASNPPVFTLPQAGDTSSPSSSSQLNLLPTNGVYTVASGVVHTSSVSASESLYGVNWYVASSGETGRGSFVEFDDGGSGVTTASLDYTFWSSGDYVITAVAYKYSDMSILGEASYTVSVTDSTPVGTTPGQSVSVPVWSDIPDPYNLTVGDSFYLYLNGYVTGSYVVGNPTTMTKSGGRIPAGLSFNSGVLSGTVTTVESLSLQFEATNSAGSAKSEWIEFKISAAVPSVSISPAPGYTSTGKVGRSYSLVATASEPISMIKWFWKIPGETEMHWSTQRFYDSATTSDRTYVSFDGTNPEKHAGKHVFRVEVTPWASLNVYQSSYTITVK